MNIPTVLKGISKTLDVTATICNKSWIVFNDEGIRFCISLYATTIEGIKESTFKYQANSTFVRQLD